MSTKVILVAASIFAELSMGCATVQPGERGIVFRPYNHEQPLEMLSPGTYSKAPWNDLIVYDLRWRTSQEKVDVQTLDKLHLSVPTAIVYRPQADKIAAIHQVLGRDFYHTTVGPALITATRTEFARHPLDAVVPNASELQTHILKDLQEKLAPHGIEVGSVAFQDLDYPPELAKAILDATVTQQQIKNKDGQLALALRDQEIAAARIKGEAESRLAAKEAEARIAQKDAEIAITRSRAEAETIKLRTASVSPMYLKLRAIEAQEALGKAPNAKLYFVPVGKDGVPVALHTDDRP